MSPLDLFTRILAVSFALLAVAIGTLALLIALRGRKVSPEQAALARTLAQDEDSNVVPMRRRR